MLICASGSLKRLLERGDYAVLFFFTKGKIQWQGDGAVVIGFGGGEVALFKAEALAVVGLGVDGDIVHVCADAVGAQVVKNLLARFAAFRLHLDGVKVQGGAVVWVAVGQGERQVGEQGIVAVGKGVAARDKFVQPRHLAYAEGGLQFGHAVVVAEFYLLVIPCAVGFVRHFIWVAGDAVAAQAGKGVGEFGAVGQAGAAFGGGDDFDGVEAEYGDVAVFAIADFAALIACADGVGGVFDDFKAVLLRELVQGGHVAGFAAQVHGDNDFGQAA